MPRFIFKLIKSHHGFKLAHSSLCTFLYCGLQYLHHYNIHFPSTYHGANIIVVVVGGGCVGGVVVATIAVCGDVVVVADATSAIFVVGVVVADNETSGRSISMGVSHLGFPRRHRWGIRKGTSTITRITMV
jgi:hypothetical protein